MACSNQAQGTQDSLADIMEGERPVCLELEDKAKPAKPAAAMSMTPRQDKTQGAKNFKTEGNITSGA